MTKRILIIMLLLLTSVLWLGTYSMAQGNDGPLIKAKFCTQGGKGCPPPPVE